MNIRNGGREEMTTRRLWAGRIVWAVLSLVAIGFLATATPGASLDVGGAPIASAVVFGAIILGYQKVIGLFARSD